jgi:hypothetical protein
MIACAFKGAYSFRQFLWGAGKYADVLLKDLEKPLKGL